MADSCWIITDDENEICNVVSSEQKALFYMQSQLDDGATKVVGKKLGFFTVASKVSFLNASKYSIEE